MKKTLHFITLFIIIFGFTHQTHALDTTAGATAANVDNARSRGLSIGDFNGDGDIDLYVGNRNGQPNQVWLSDGAGDYTELQIATDLGSTHATLAGDVDGDGDIDLYAINATGGSQNRLWINDGTGAFTNADIVGDTNSGFGGDIGDLDGDGDLDIYVATVGTPSQNQIWINDGTGSFTAGDIVGDDSNSTDASLVDVDGDGDLDVYVGVFGQNKLWINDGTASFTANDITGDTLDTYGVIYGDVDGDGDQDLYAATQGGQNKLWMNDGTGEFTANDITGDTGTTQTAAMGDLDGDGDLDIYTVNNGQNKVWINDGTGSFTNDDIVGDLGDSHAAAIFDQNGDGDNDIFVTTEAAVNLLWLITVPEPEPDPEPETKKGGRYVRYVCADKDAVNYDPELSRFGRHNNTLCRYEKEGGVLNMEVVKTVSDKSLVFNKATGEYITLTTTSEYCNNITENDIVLESQLSNDEEFLYPLGLIDFEIECEKKGASSFVTIYYSTEYVTDNWLYKKYDKESGMYKDVTDYVTFGSAVLDGKKVTTISFTIKDGDSLMDGDGMEDGVISDPSGPALLVSALPFAQISEDGIVYICKDPRAKNYTLTKLGQHLDSACDFGEDNYLADTDINSSNRCDAEKTITQRLRLGARDGAFDIFTGSVVSQVALLQKHINRILETRYDNAAGPVDGVFGTQTQRGVERLQMLLNDVIKPSPNLIIDGIVGKYTTNAINATCPAVEV